MFNQIKTIIGLGIVLGTMSCAQAEVLVILPESGPMARAGLSIKQGFLGAYQAAKRQERLKFVNSDGQNIADLWNKQVTAETQLVVGPLARQDIETIIQLKPSVQTLALNDVEASAEHVAKFSLSKREDAQALLGVMQQDQIRDLFIVAKPGTLAEHELFLKALLHDQSIQTEVVDSIPEQLSADRGLLLLGDVSWLNSLKNLPNTRVYTIASAVEQVQSLAEGIKFCDTPARYTKTWKDTQQAIAQAQSSAAFQRLIAFGGDAWQIAQVYLDKPEPDTQLMGRTGEIKIAAQQISRRPQCFVKQQQQLKML